jgi:hypothetical protein
VQSINSLEELTELACSNTTVFLRYSLGPDEDAATVSRDYEAQLDLPGLPVTTLRPESWWSREPADWVARRVCKYVGLAQQDPRRRPWLLTGQIVGYGPDHEPLIGQVHPLAWLGDELVQEARRRYEERFDVGRDSTG